MSQDFKAGDYLIFQVESGFGLLRLLGRSDEQTGTVWHLRAYSELFPDIDSAEDHLSRSQSLTVSVPHVALTTRAFEATQVARLAHEDLTSDESESITGSLSEGREVSDRSIRLILGLR